MELYPSSDNNMTACLIIGFSRPSHLSRCIDAALESGFDRIHLSIDTCSDSAQPSLVKANQSVIDTATNYFNVFDAIVSLHVNDKPLGLKVNVVSSINRVFESESFLAILEDDIVSTKSFVDFLGWAGECFKDHPTINHVAGINPFAESNGSSLPYYQCCLSSFHYCWGWATWKHKWNDNLLNYPFPHGFFNLFIVIIRHWPRLNFFHVASHTFQLYKALNGYISSWAYLWGLYSIVNGQYAFLPPFSLVSNTGLGHASTHTRYSLYPFDSSCQDSTSLFPTIDSNIPHSFPDSLINMSSRLVDMWELRQRYSLLKRLTRFFLRP